MASIFDYANAVSHTKEDIIRTAENPEVAEKAYNAYMTNRALSYHIDTVLFANDMNQNGHLDNIIQFDYLFNSIRPKKRFARWVKPEKNEDIEAVMQAFQYRRERAIQAMKTLTDEDLLEIHAALDRGGSGKR